MLADFLESIHYHVIQTRSGFNLLKRIVETRPDLILVDIQMPGMDGLEIIQQIRSHKNAMLAATPIIALTALSMPGDRDRCLQAGANEYISKPVMLLDLAAMIHKLVGQMK